MYQLSYRSTARPTLEASDFEQILKEARARNLCMNITGCLVYYDQCFVQILEGEKRHVHSVFEKLKNDTRHFSVTLLWEGQAKERQFKEWSMAFYHGHESSHINGLEKQKFVNNMMLLSEFSNKSSSTLLTFWATVKSMLNDESTVGEIIP